jgi:hypothetical protein
LLSLGKWRDLPLSAGWDLSKHFLLNYVPLQQAISNFCCLKIRARSIDGKTEHVGCR